MRNKIIVITAFVGFIIGLLVAFYLLLVGHSFGLIDAISLTFVVDSLPLTEELGWIVAPLFFVVLYTFYGAMIGLMIQKFTKT